METTIISANVIRNAENSSRVINLATSEEFDFIDPNNAFAHGKRKLLKISMKQFMHFINEANSDIADDVAFTLMATGLNPCCSGRWSRTSFKFKMLC